MFELHTVVAKVARAYLNSFGVNENARLEKNRKQTGCNGNLTCYEAGDRNDMSFVCILKLHPRRKNDIPF